MRVIPQESGFGAEIADVSLSQPLSEKVRLDLVAAWNRHSVVWIRNQSLSHDQLEAFTSQIGPFADDLFVEPVAGHPHVLELRREPSEKAMNYGAGWHSDWSFQACPPSASILHSKVIPPAGGDTLFADGCRAFESLSTEIKNQISGLFALHSGIGPFGREGFFAREKEQRAMKICPNVSAEMVQRHPVVRTHPVTGRKALYVNPTYTLSIEGLPPDESKSLLKLLCETMAQDTFVLRHRWEPNMLLMWDNRCTMHKAEGGYNGHLRVLHRTTVAGDAPF